VAREGETVFLTTHDMHEAEQLCDEIAIMDAGRIVVQGTFRGWLASTRKGKQAVWVQANSVALLQSLEHLVPNIGESRAVTEHDGHCVCTEDWICGSGRLCWISRVGSADFAVFRSAPRRSKTSSFATHRSQARPMGLFVQKAARCLA